MKFRVALAQVRSSQADPKANLAEIAKICQLKEIQHGLPTIVIFPEMSVTGYLMHDDVYHLAESIPSGPMSKKLSEISKQNNCYLIVGMPESSIPGLLYNTAVLFGPEGYIGKSRKIYLPNHSVFNERRYFKSAQSVNILNTPIGKLGLQICYDIFCPEITRAHALLGAHTSICVSASPGVRRQYFESFIPARAMENTINFVYVNQAGIQDDLIFWGGSEVRSATGKQILKLKYDESDFGIAKLTTESPQSAKNFVPTLKDLPSWIYSELEESSYDG
ncbi:MAG: carbon-nitrogen hydrolase family protein [Candidatus Hodarchaeales archaeon]|jgi:predicted amidohydrolase